MAEEARKNNNYEKAIEYYGEAGKLWLTEEKKRNYALMQNNIGYLYYGLGKYDQALEYYERALMIYEVLNDETGIAMSSNNIGLLYKARGKNDMALEYFERALAIGEKLGNKADVAVYLSSIASVYKSWGKYNQALEYFERALAIDEELWNEIGIARNLNNIGGVYDSLGEFQISVEYFITALSIVEEIGDKSGIARGLNNIGGVYHSWGKYDIAIEYFEKALVIDKTLGRKIEIAIRLNNIGMVYQSWGKYDLALEYYEHTLTISEKLNNKEIIAGALNNIAMLYKLWGKYDLALEYYSRALNIAEEMKHKDWITGVLNNIGTVYKSWKKYDLALKYFKKTLVISKEMENKVNVTRVLTNIGGVYQSQRKYDIALEYYMEALTIAKEIRDNENIAAALNNIGVVYFDQQMYDQAITYFRRSISIKEQLRLTAPGAIRRDYLASQIETYQALTSAAIRAGKITEALNAAEQSKARFLVERMGEQINLNKLSFKPIQERQKELSPDEVVLVLTNVNQKYPGIFVITRNRLQATEIDKNPFILSIQEKYGEHIKFTLDLNRSLQFLRSKKDENQNDNIFEDIISYYHYLLTKPYPSKTDTEKREKIGRALYELFIGPVETQISGKKRITIVQDGILGLIPFETFINKRGRYLVEEHSLRYTHSLAVSDLVARRRYNSDNKTVLAFGGATYEVEIEELQSNETDSSSNNGKKVSSAIVSEEEINYAITRGPKYLSDVYHRMGLRWNNLPGTLEEVEEIGSIFPNSTVYTGAKVKESLVKRLSTHGELKKYKILHFSTHGIVVPEFPELSALVLTQEGNEKEDGYLSMSEISALDMEAEFVNLSACETGLGKIYAGEGIVGLTQSFLIAGAKGLSVSLWQVADNATKDFMIGMYKKVKNEYLSYAEAIREMKLEFLKGKYKAPFFWAPFIYYGE